MAKKYSIEWWQELKPEKVGKETELLVESVLKKLNGQQHFAWHRLPDARAAIHAGVQTSVFQNLMRLLAEVK